MKLGSAKLPRSFRALRDLLPQLCFYLSCFRELPRMSFCSKPLPRTQPHAIFLTGRKVCHSELLSSSSSLLLLSSLKSSAFSTASSSASSFRYLRIRLCFRAATSKLCALEARLFSRGTGNQGSSFRGASARLPRCFRGNPIRIRFLPRFFFATIAASASFRDTLLLRSM